MAKSKVEEKKLLTWRDVEVLDENFICKFAAQLIQFKMKDQKWQRFEWEFLSKFNDLANEMGNQVLDHEQSRITDSDLFGWGTYFVVRRVRRKESEKFSPAYFKTQQEAEVYITWKDSEHSEGWVIEKVEQLSMSEPKLTYEYDV